MPTNPPTHDAGDADRKIDSDEAWARMGQPTGRKTLSFWWLFLGTAVTFFLIVIATFVLQAWAGE